MPICVCSNDEHAGTPIALLLWHAILGPYFFVCFHEIFTSLLSCPHHPLALLVTLFVGERWENAQFPSNVLGQKNPRVVTVASWSAWEVTNLPDMWVAFRTRGSGIVSKLYIMPSFILLLPYRFFCNIFYSRPFGKVLEPRLSSHSAITILNRAFSKCHLIVRVSLRLLALTSKTKDVYFSTISTSWTEGIPMVSLVVHGRWWAFMTWDGRNEIFSARFGTWTTPDARGNLTSRWVQRSGNPWVLSFILHTTSIPSFSIVWWEIVGTRVLLLVVLIQYR